MHNSRSKYEGKLGGDYMEKESDNGKERAAVAFNFLAKRAYQEGVAWALTVKNIHFAAAADRPFCSDA